MVEVAADEALELAFRVRLLPSRAGSSSSPTNVVVTGPDNCREWECERANLTDPDRANEAAGRR